MPFISLHDEMLVITDGKYDVLIFLAVRQLQSEIKLILYQNGWGGRYPLNKLTWDVIQCRQSRVTVMRLRKV